LPTKIAEIVDERFIRTSNDIAVSSGGAREQPGLITPL